MEMLEKLVDTEFDWECPWFGMHHWEGISLLTLLKEVGARREAKYIKFMASDGLTAEFSISVLKKHPKIMLAIKMDGEYMPESKVGPLRVVIPYDEYPDLLGKFPPYPYTIGWIIETEVGG